MALSTAPSEERRAGEASGNQSAIRVGTVLYTLYGTETGKRKEVVAAVDAAIAAAVRASAGDWTVPCDIVGLDSKKAKAAKIRFHSSTLDEARSDAALAAAVRVAAHDLITVACADGAWRDADADAPRADAVVDTAAASRVRRLLGAVAPRFTVCGDVVCLAWPLHTTPSCSKTAVRAVKEARAALGQASKLPIGVRVRSEDGQQMLEVDYRHAGASQTVWRMRFDEGYLVESSEENGEWSPKVELSSRGLHIFVRRALQSSERSSAARPPRLPRAVGADGAEGGAVTTTIDTNGVEKPAVMVDAVQCRVEELRRRLDESLALFQKQSTARTVKDVQRQLIVLNADRTETTIEICEPGARPRLRQLAASTPLKVVVSDGGMASASDFASSPSESVDSGVSSSSPIPSPPVFPKASPFYQYSEEISATAKLMNGMRCRAVSESSGLTASSSLIVQAPTMPLKSILKKTTQTAGGIRSRRTTWSDSTDGSSPFFVMRTLAVSTTVEDLIEEGDETAFETSGEMSDVDSHSDPAAEADATRRVKRVSFSEHIQQRSFKANSSILAQKNKNARKERSKRRREERRNSETRSESDVTSDHHTTTEDEKVPSQTMTKGKAGKSAANKKAVEKAMESAPKPALRETRKDSGYGDDDELGSDGETVERDEEEADDEADANATASPTATQPQRAAGARVAPRARAKAAAFTIGAPTVLESDWMVLVRRRWTPASE